MVNVLIVVAAAVALVVAAEAALHRVGDGKYTWSPGVNFSDWASHEHFIVGDWIYFGFDRQRYNVLEVNKTSYDECSGEGFLTNITRGGRDVFQLTEPKSYYFMCSRGDFCEKGMKLRVDAQEAPPAPTTPPAPSPPKDSAASTASVVSSAFLSLLLPVFLFVTSPYGRDWSLYI